MISLSVQLNRKLKLNSTFTLSTFLQLDSPENFASSALELYIPLMGNKKDIKDMSPNNIKLKWVSLNQADFSGNVAEKAKTGLEGKNGCIRVFLLE